MNFSIPRWCRIAGILVLGVLCALVFFHWLAPPLLPFILALGLARLMEPAVRLLHERARLPRPIASLIMTLLGVALLLGFLAFLVSWVMGEAGRLMENLPHLLAKLPEISAARREQANAVIAAAPLSLQNILRNTLERLWNEGVAIPSSVYGFLASLISALASAIPSAGLFLFATVLSTYLISRDYPGFTRRILSPFSQRIRRRILFTKDEAFRTLGQWFRAQLYMLGLTFLILLAGFLLLRVEVVLLPAVVITLLDALPVIGVGLCLIPWALAATLGGDTFLGAGLLILYAAVFVTRSVVEPRLIGRQIGLDPLLTFAAMYAGFKIVGLPGLIVFPVLATVLFRVAAAFSSADEGAKDLCRQARKE